MSGLLNVFPYVPKIIFLRERDKNLTQTQLTRKAKDSIFSILLQVGHLVLYSYRSSAVEKCLLPEELDSKLL